MPCPEKVNIPAVLRFELFFSVYGLKNWARKLYGGLEGKADKCSKCGMCQQKCPYNLPVEGMLKRAHEGLA
jgi:predicted aldo/keto reductase-like oxidoreductase